MATSRFRQGLAQIRARGGLGSVLGEALFPIPPEVASQTDPATLNKLRKSAMIQMGLGMIAAKDRGAGLGGGLQYGMAQGQDALQGGLGQIMGVRRANREDSRLDLAEKRTDAQLKRQDQLDARDVADRATDIKWRETQSALSEKERAIDNARQERMLALQAAQLQQGTVPAGYRKAADGSLEAIPGGPADPTGPGARKVSQPLRKEFRALPSVRDYETALPIFESAKKAPDTGYGDLQLIYTVGKLLDPNSVVREGELALTIAAGSPLQRIIGATRFTTEQGGRLPPKSRQQIMEMLKERIGSYKQAYDKDYQQYGTYATELNIDPELVVGKPAESAYAPKSTAGPTVYGDAEKERRYQAWKKANGGG